MLSLRTVGGRRLTWLHLACPIAHVQVGEPTALQWRQATHCYIVQVCVYVCV